MARLKIELFMNDEDERAIKGILASLKKRKAKDGDFEESGGLGVRVEQNTPEYWEFSIYRIEGFRTEMKHGKN